MMYTQVQEAPRRDEWGWTISRPNQLVPLLEEMARDEEKWTELLLSQQKRDMPTLGQNFPLLAGMIKRIYNNDDDPAWRRLDKGHTPCQTPKVLLKLVAKCMKKSPYELTDLNVWLENVLDSCTHRVENPKIWLLFLRRALLSAPDHQALADRDRLSFEYDSIGKIAIFIDKWWNNAITTLPLM